MSPRDPEKTSAPYGSWPSPISAALLASAGVGLGALQVVAGNLLWLELRPAENGRLALVRRRPDGTIADIGPADGNLRTLVHEYGGGAYAARADGAEITVLASEFADQRLYRYAIGPLGVVRLAWSPEPPSARSLRYADGRFSPTDDLFVCVRERHEGDDVSNELVALSPTTADEARVIAAGHDFYAAPRFSPDGRALAWLSWDHPHMPWDGTELWVAEVTAAGLGAAQLVAGGPGESVLQPAWSPDGRLHYISDRSGWWNLYAAVSAAALADQNTAAALADPNASTARPTSASALVPRAAEFAKPSWVFGLQNYAFLSDGRIVCFFSEGGRDRLAVIEPGDPSPARLRLLPSAFTTFSQIASDGETVAVIGGSAEQAATVALVDPDDGALDFVREGRAISFDRDYLATPEPISFPVAYAPGSVRGPLLKELAGEQPLEAHALYYPPTSPTHGGPADERPPLVVMAHGGPTSARESILSLDIQYWTSRGVAVVDVNYGGSTGYGRAYRERLRGNWGIVDTVDCIAAAQYLVARGAVDARRVAIQGGSAGGYTTLNALTRHSYFSAGASYFGLADLEIFADGGTHKFESRYLDGLIGPFPTALADYRERSPIHHVNDISCPVIILQGLEDAIVPPEQAEVIVAALRAKGLPFSYLAFAGEQHGFRKAENIIRSEEAVLTFYGRIFAFEPADDLPPLTIENAPPG